MRISDWSSDVCSSDLVTRLLAVFHSTDAAPAGPVRSARTSDIAIFSPLHRPYFAWSVANPTFASRIRGSNNVEDRKSVVSGKSVSVRVDLGGRRINT